MLMRETAIQTSLATTNKIHHYEEPLTLLKKSSIAHFTDKYDNPINKMNSFNHNNYYQTQFISDENTKQIYHQYHHPHNHQQQETTMKQQNERQRTILRSSKSLGSLNIGNKKKSLTENKSLTTSSERLAISNNTSGQDLLDDNEINQIELFFRSNKTFVYASRCMANLYITKTDLVNGGRISSPRSHEWELIRTGIPVIVFDKGETRSRHKRQLQIYLAERGTGFPLWKDVIDNLTDYRSIHPTFHTLYLSCDHRKMAGLSFDCVNAAETFLNEIDEITSDPLNIALSVPTKKKLTRNKSNKKSKELVPKLPRKCDISTPCLFQHVTNVDLNDFTRFQSVNSLYPNLYNQMQMNNDNKERDKNQRRQSSLSLNESRTISPPIPPSSTASPSITSESSSQFSL